MSSLHTGVAWRVAAVAALIALVVLLLRLADGKSADDINAPPEAGHDQRSSKSPSLLGPEINRQPAPPGFLAPPSRVLVQVVGENGVDAIERARVGFLATAGGVVREALTDESGVASVGFDSATSLRLRAAADGYDDRVLAVDLASAIQSQQHPLLIWLQRKGSKRSLAGVIYGAHAEASSVWVTARDAASGEVAAVLCRSVPGAHVFSLDVIANNVSELTAVATHSSEVRAGSARIGPQESYVVINVTGIGATDPLSSRPTPGLISGTVSSAVDGSPHTEETVVYVRSQGSVEMPRRVGSFADGTFSFGVRSGVGAYELFVRRPSELRPSGEESPDAVSSPGTSGVVLVVAERPEFVLEVAGLRARTSGTRVQVTDGRWTMPLAIFDLPPGDSRVLMRGVAPGSQYSVYVGPSSEGQCAWWTGPAVAGGVAQTTAVDAGEARIRVLNSPLGADTYRVGLLGQHGVVLNGVAAHDGEWIVAGVMPRLVWQIIVIDVARGSTGWVAKGVVARPGAQYSVSWETLVPTRIPNMD